MPGLPAYVREPRAAWTWPVALRPTILLPSSPNLEVLGVAAQKRGGGVIPNAGVKGGLVGGLRSASYLLMVVVVIM